MDELQPFSDRLAELGEGLPQSPDESWPRGPLFAPLFRHLLGRLNQFAQELDESREALGSGTGDDHDDAELLEASRADGWMLGVVAAAGGIDLLFERREPDGFSILVTTVKELLQGGGIVLANSESVLPAVSGRGAEWERPWAVSNLLFVAATEQSSKLFGWNLNREKDGYVLTVKHPAGPALIRFARELETSLPGSSFCDSKDEWSFLMADSVQREA